MKPAKPLRLVLIGALGVLLFTAGFAVSQFFGYARIARMLAPVAPVVAEMQTMSQEEARESLALLRENARRVVKETDLQSLFQALTAHEALSLRAQDKESAAWSSLERYITYFRKRYESKDLQLGDWQEVADKIYQQTSKAQE
jgi:predicted RNase H-like nuclease